MDYNARPMFPALLKQPTEKGHCAAARGNLGNTVHLVTDSKRYIRSRCKRAS